jgi:hypothetical protein
MISQGPMTKAWQEQEVMNPEQDFFFRYRANDSIMRAQHESGKFHEGLREREEARLRGFAPERLRAIVKRRKKQLQRIDYVRDVLDVLLHHIDEPEHLEGRQRHGMTMIIEQDYRLYLSVARQELHFQRQLLIVVMEAVRRSVIMQSWWVQ